MQTVSVLQGDLNPACLEQWQQFTERLAADRLHHAMLLRAPAHVNIQPLVDRMSAAILCTAKLGKPCHQCKSCHLFTTNQHPDCFQLQPEKPRGMIKIEQIRALQSLVFTSPQLSSKRVIQVNPADKMNLASANAFLKLLEEPAANVHFILLAEHLSHLLPTILSRCQKWTFPAFECLPEHYLKVALHYPPESSRGQLFSQLPILLEDLQTLLTQQSSVCQVASKWLNTELPDFLWLLYLMTAQMLSYQLAANKQQPNEFALLAEIAEQIHPVILFQQLDKINQITQALNLNKTLNQTLVLESLFLGYQFQGWEQQSRDL